MFFYMEVFLYPNVIEPIRRHRSSDGRCPRSQAAFTSLPLPKIPSSEGTLVATLRKRYLGSTSNIFFPHKRRHRLRCDENFELRLRSSSSVRTHRRPLPSIYRPKIPQTHIHDILTHLIYTASSGRHPRIKIPRDNRHRSGARLLPASKKNARDATPSRPRAILV